MSKSAWLKWLKASIHQLDLHQNPASAGFFFTRHMSLRFAAYLFWVKLDRVRPFGLSGLGQVATNSEHPGTELVPLAVIRLYNQECRA